MAGNTKRKKQKAGKIFLGIIGILCFGGAAAAGLFFIQRSMHMEKPDELLKAYMNHIQNKEYEEMYRMIDVQASGDISLEEFTKRNSNIYEGIEINNLQVEIMEYKEKQAAVIYRTSFDTLAGEISFDNTAFFEKNKEGYQLIWNDGMIFPELKAEDKVKVITTKAVRGRITDRSGFVLAGQGVASSVGIVPGKLENKEEALKEISELTDTEIETIEKKLDAQWVKEDSFVPIVTLPKVSELDLMKTEPDTEVMQEAQRQALLLGIPGIMITDIEVREYPFEEAAAHLVGYVQNVTAEDLENHPGEGYTSDSVIGKGGMESLFEKELKGQNGYKILIMDGNDQAKSILAEIPVQDGQNIQLSIDISLQNALYEQFREDKSCSVAMNPYTGEVLALVSTPSYDTNEFIRGMSQSRWDALNEDEKMPLYNRFRQVWCPGSTFKPVTAAIGLDTGDIAADEDYGYEGLSWQKDSTWGSYYVTTLHDYSPATLENALIYSDNIYFAKAALRIGEEKLSGFLDSLGFGSELPFEIVMTQSQYSNGGGIQSEVQLADSGYGQGQILVNPLHLACIYTAFCNGGNMIRPYLVYQEKPEPDIWISQAFSQEASQRVLEGMVQVVNNSEGTGYGAHREDMVFAGKTGTAEIKASADDTTGTELGWFAVMTTDIDAEKPILLISMTEDVKEIGGSGYVVNKDKAVLDWYLS